MSDPQIADRYHLSLTIDQTLWPALGGCAALQGRGGAFDRKGLVG